MPRVPLLIVPFARRGDTLNAAETLQERIRSAFAPSVAPATLSAAAATSSGAGFDLDLAYRVAAIRRLISGRVVFTTSFGLEDQAIAHAIFSQALAIDVVTLDTGRLFPETYQLWGQTEDRYGRRIIAVYPDHDGAETLVARRGINGFYTSVEARHACCAVRKVEPLRRALAGAVAWITGLRADQSAERAAASFAIVAPRHRLIKVSPLFDWTRDQVVTFIRNTTFPTMPCMTAGSLRSAARHVRGRYLPVFQRAPGDGGGSRSTTRTAGPLMGMTRSRPHLCLLRRHNRKQRHERTPAHLKHPRSRRTSHRGRDLFHRRSSCGVFAKLCRMAHGRRLGLPGSSARSIARHP